MSTVAVAYMCNEDRFSGETENIFEGKLDLFHERCTQNDVEEMEKPKSLSIILSENTFQYYFDHLQNCGLNFDSHCESIRKILMTEKHTRPLLREFDTITLQ